MAHKFIRKRAEFNRKHAAFKDMMQGRMAMDIETSLKTRSGMPVRTGNMKAQTRHFRSPSGGFRVEVNVAYAEYQERGSRRDGSNIVRSYTTGGTGKGFFLRAIKSVTRNRTAYVLEAKKAVGL